MFLNIANTQAAFVNSLSQLQAKDWIYSEVEMRIRGNISTPAQSNSLLQNECVPNRWSRVYANLNLNHENPFPHTCCSYPCNFLYANLQKCFPAIKPKQAAGRQSCEIIKIFGIF